MAVTHKTLPPKPGKEDQFIKVGSPGTVKEALAGKFEGKGRGGFLGGNIIRKDDYVVQENLSVDEKAQKKALQVLLGQTIEPNAISSKSTPAMDRRSLVTKLGKSTLDDILRLCPERLKAMNSKELQEVLAGNDPLSEDE